MEEYDCDHLVGKVKVGAMKALIEQFAEWHRLTGTPASEQAAGYITDQLRAYGINFERYEFDAYFSDPIKAELQFGMEKITCKPRSASANCPDGREGEVILDTASQGRRLSGNEERELYSKFRGKIVLSWNFYEDYVKKIESYGAIGLIHIWGSGEDCIHEETVGPIWGTPTLDNAGQFPTLPVVGVNRADGCRMIAHIEAGPIRAVIHSWVNYRLARTSLPIASIPGKTQDYILVSGHYDSWHEGVTDNATGNAACLELARVFAEASGKLERGVKIAWWPGHSNGRYMGSTWYCDHFWEDLHDHCVGHINIDSPGSQGGALVLPRTTRMEGTRFTRDLIRAFLGKEPATCLDIPRGADQSFWGVDIPFHIMYKYEPLAENKIYNCPGSGGGWWWHSEFDSLDKVDYELLLRDTRLLTATVHLLADAKRLPSDFEAYFNRMLTIFRGLDGNSDAAFEFKPIIEATVALADQVNRVINAAAGDAQVNMVIRMVGGRLNRLMYSSCDPFNFDNTFAMKPFPGLRMVENLYRDETPADQFLFALTSFTRQRNRFLNEMRVLKSDLVGIL